MFKTISTLLSLIAFSSISFGNTTLKECSTVLAVTRTGDLTLTDVEPTDVRGLPSAALAQIVKTLKDKWIQIETRDPIPSLGNPEGVNHYLIKVLGTGQGIRFGQYMMTVIAGVGETSVPKSYNRNSQVKSEISPPTKIDLNTVIFLNDITSVQLVEDPEITVSLFNKFDGKPFYAKPLDEKIMNLADDDPEAPAILVKLAEARYPKMNSKQGEEFEAFLGLLGLLNIRGRDLVTAFQDYARGNIDALISGVIEKPHDVAKAINKPSESVISPAEYKRFN